MSDSTIAVINVLLTAAIALAAIMQWVVSGRLLSLQKVIEDQRTKAWLFLRLKPSALHGHATALLEISNLSQVGVWLEKVTVHLEVPAGTPNKAKAVQIENVLPPMQTGAGVDIRSEVHSLVQPNGRQVPAITWVEAEFWVNGQWQRERTGRYSMNVDGNHLQDVRRV
jgi:hypothetical protein